MNIYCIPGLGNDNRIFRNLQWRDGKMIHVHWENPAGFNNMEAYAGKLKEQIDASQPFALLGLSLGGMLAVEIAKSIKPEKLILISSAKTRDELPWFMKICALIPLHRYLPSKWLVFMSMKLKSLVGIQKGWNMDLLQEMLGSIPPEFIKKHIDFLVSWKNKQNPEHFIHLHGDCDKVIPVSNIQNAQIITGGTHFMVLHKGAIISDLIYDCVNKNG